MRERSNFWDNYKGILILLVVFGHFIYNTATHLTNSFIYDIFAFIYLFHMPAFVFCSGFWSKESTGGIKKVIVKLLFCYLIFNALFMLYYCTIKGAPVQFLTPYASAWYLLSLIIWRVSVPYLDKIKGIFPISVAAALLVGFWPEFSNIFALSRTVVFFPFFLIGYRLKEKRVREYLEKRTVLKNILGYAVAIVGAACLFVLIRRSGITLSMLIMQPYRSARDMIYRLFILISAAAAIIALMITVPKRKIPVLSKIGKNSLLIYLTHRFITFVFDRVFPHTEYSRLYIVYAAAATMMVVLIFGSEIINRVFQRVLNWLVDCVVCGTEIGKRVVSVTLAVVILLSAGPLASAVKRVLSKPEEPGNVDEVISDTVVLSFVGDLILLKDQVEAAYEEETGEYQFDSVFEQVKEYFSYSDFTIGIFEGPMAGKEKGYTTSDFYDRGKLLLNFPDSYAYAVKEAGIDLVSTSNNHLLDMGMEGAMRTLDVLDEVGIVHTGTYRNQTEKDQLCLVEVEGISIAVLSYTWAVNNNGLEQMVLDYPQVTSMLPDKESELFPKLMEEIEQDFEQAKQSGADLIVVLPHMGTQFSHETDEFQMFWNQTFAELGADIILGDHAHAVQPIEQVGETLVVNCPGNFANSYIQHNGDASAIVEVYINRETKKPVASAVVPMYVQEMRSGYFRAVPIYTMLTQEDVYEQMANIDLERASQVHELITEVMIGEKISTENVQPRYFWMDGKYCEKQYSLLGDAEVYADTQLYQYLNEAETVVYIGDSITNGSHNQGHPWYEPLMKHFEGKQVTNISKPSYTTRLVLENLSSEISKTQGDLFVLAIGTNDVRYRNEETCAMTPETYIENMEQITSLILKTNSNAKIVMISPWITLSNDRNSKVGHEEKLKLFDIYGKALSDYSEKMGYCFIDPNEYILKFFETHQRYQYTTDGIHPKAPKGIDLYSWAVMEGAR